MTITQPSRAVARGPEPEPQGAPVRPIRVLHVITRLIVGGAMENTILTAIGQHRDPRFDVTVFSGVDLGREGNLHEFTRAAGVKLVIYDQLRRPIHPWRDLRTLIHLTRFITHGNYDVVHTHTSKAGILGRLAARLAGTPVVVHTLHSLVFHAYQNRLANAVYIQLKRLCAPLTDQFISVCRATQDGALAARIGTPERHATVFSGMELEPFLAVAGAPRGDARRDFDIPEDATVVGKIARLFENKGHEYFVDAADLVHRSRPDVHFLVVGDGDLRESLEADVHRRGLGDVFHFAGLLPPEEVPRALRAMDVVVHASVREGIARVLPQAMAAARPTVAFDLDGAPEVIQDGVSGFLIPPLDTQAMAARILDLVDDPAMRRRLGRAGQAFVAREFPTERMVEKINALYLRRLDEAGIVAWSRR